MIEKQYQKDLEILIQETIKTSALQAINLNQLLKKKWTEEKNSYMILSKIQTEKQKRRIFNLTKEI